MKKNSIINLTIIALLLINLAYSMLILNTKIDYIYKNLNTINTTPNIEKNICAISEDLQILNNDIDFIKKNIELNNLKKNLDISKCYISTGKILHDFRHGDLLFQDTTTNKRYRLNKSLSLKNHELSKDKLIKVYIINLSNEFLTYDNIEYDASGEVVYYEYVN